MVNDPAKRMTWSEILEHKFVKGNILILKEDSISESPFTSALSHSQYLKKEKQTALIMKNHSHRHRKQGAPAPVYDDNVLSSRDSIKAIIQSDMEEVLETDVDEDPTNPTSKSETSDERVDKEPPAPFPVSSGFQLPPEPLKMPGGHNINFSVVPENNNLVINRFYDNFPGLENPRMPQQIAPNMVFSQFGGRMPPFNLRPQNPPVPINQEIKKLNQDLENFSLRIDKSVEAEAKPTDSKHTPTKSDATLSHIMSTDDSINSPVENEEWLQFLFKSMQEILDGEFDIYKQENMITMIVALLRNSKANLKVVHYVSQILCLPYAIEMPASILDDIEKVYVQVKLVPNLVYAAKLLCSKKLKANCCESSSDTPISLPKLNGIVTFNDQELKSLASLFDLVCFLVYSGETFLHQFCDALSILNVNEILASFIVAGKLRALLI